jgi:hypothetical protein
MQEKAANHERSIELCGSDRLGLSCHLWRIMRDIGGKVSRLICGKFRETSGYRLTLNRRYCSLYDDWSVQYFGEAATETWPGLAPW